LLLSLKYSAITQGAINYVLFGLIFSSIYLNQYGKLQLKKISIRLGY